MMNAWRYESLFSYNVTRPYPFRWFTPSVVAGSVVGMVVFTLVNLITQGFQIVTVSTADPANLVSDWERSLPAFLTGRIRPTCSPVQVSVGSIVYSSNKGLSYRLAGVNQRVDGSPWSVQSALTYSNDPIKNCTVTALSISLNGKSRSPQERAWMEWGPQARAQIQCDIPVARNPIFQSTLVDPPQTVRVTLTTTYDYTSEDIAYGPWRVSNQGLQSNPNSIGLSSLVVESETESNPSLFWAASLLSMYWSQTSARMSNATEKITSSSNNNNGTQAQLSAGIVYFQRNPQSNDIKDLSFFDIDYRMFFDQPNGAINTSFAGPSDTVASLAATERAPNIWIPVDSLAKSLWSTIMADLGDRQQTQVIVKDAALTTYFTSNFSQILAELDGTRLASARPGPSREDFATAGARRGPLGVGESVVDSQYLCQQPQWKQGGEIFVLVLAQNIVFLGSLWRVWTLVVGWLFLRQDRLGRDISYCEGHVDEYREKEVLKGAAMEMPPPPQQQQELGMSRRWARQEERTYDNGSVIGMGLGYRAVPGSVSPAAPISRFSKDYKTSPQVTELERS